MAPPSADNSNNASFEPPAGDSEVKTKPVVKPRRQRLSPPTFEDKYEERQYLRGRLALALRIFGKLGYDEGVAGSITMRDPVDPTSYWTNPFGISWDLMRASDLIQIDSEGKSVDGSFHLLNTAAYMIHKARPEVNCVAHSHSIHGRAFSTLGRKLDSITQDACAFHGDLALSGPYKGAVLADEEGQHIVEALGLHKAILLRNHGPLTVGTSVESAVFWFMSLEKCCHVQLLAEAAAAGVGASAVVKIADQDAAATYKTVGTEQAGFFSALPTFGTAERDAGPEYLE